MDLSRYAEDIRRQLETAAEAGGPEARTMAERLVVPLDASIRLALLESLTAAADEITVELAPGSVEVRLRGRDPEFVVTLPPADPSLGEQSEGVDTGAGWPSGSAVLAVPGEEGSIARINLRLPEHLKTQVERAADGQGLSVNAWLVRAAAAALQREESAQRRERRTPHGAQRYRGWAR
jgi:HicB family